MSKLDLEWLSVFDRVYETRSVSRAAEHLGIAQATASIALNKLRAHFDDKLFTRTPSGMQPTCLLYTSPSPRDKRQSRMPSSA